MDLVIRGGLIVDGSGRPGIRGDVGIDGGRIVALGDVGDADRSIDADGLAVAPGFVDVHTHYDAQALWDPTLSPSPLHGVTTVISGNCGFTLAPLAPQDADYLANMLARVEGMPIEVIEATMPWTWDTTGAYLDQLEGSLLPNAGFLVGHSAIRRAVMHEEATTRAATPEELEAMCAILRTSLAGGGLGFSSTWSPSHNDHLGVPVPSRWASREELLALAAVTGEFPGTTLEFIPGVPPFPDEVVEVMADMSAIARRPLNWNVLIVHGGNVDLVPGMLRTSDVAAERGGHVVALTNPDALRARMSFFTGFIYDMLPGWTSFTGRSVEERIAQLRDPARRAELGALAASATTGSMPYFADWGAYRVETTSPETARHHGALVADIAQAAGTSAWNAVCDILVADGLRTTLIPPPRGDDDASWKRRAEVWRDPRAMIGASDAGAHLDMIDTFSYSTVLLGEGVRRRCLLSLEEAVHLLTARPAAFYGLRGRGTLSVGAHADVVVFDPSTVGPGPVGMRYDMPGGAGRVYGGAEGIEHVLVNGTPVVRGADLLGDRPGTVLRGGRDTETFTFPSEVGR